MMSEEQEKNNLMEHRFIKRQVEEGVCIVCGLVHSLEKCTEKLPGHPKAGAFKLTYISHLC